ncbi:mitochondrial fission ELM1 family protein [Candidatus Raskinella chloraquaticus]
MNPSYNLIAGIAPVAQQSKPEFSRDLLERLSCWVISDGKAGMENQCLGLAERLGLQPEIKRVQLRSPWRELSPWMRMGQSHALSRKGDPLSAPWPDLIIATGRASVATSLWVKKKSGGRTLCVQIQNPVVGLSRFDLVVMPEHDGISGPNVVATRGGLHRVTPEFLAKEAERWAPLVDHLPVPRLAVLVGGSNGAYQLTPREMVRLTVSLAALAKEKKMGLMVTPSRRTGEANLAILQAGLHDCSAVIWDGQGDNPYYGFLGLADAFVVTCDSVNMVSEAASTGKPLHVVHLPGGSAKFTAFHQAMERDGYCRPFAGKIEEWRYSPLNDMQLVADRVRQLLVSRRG